MKTVKLNAHHRTGYSMWEFPRKEDLMNLKNKILLIHDSEDKIIPIKELYKLNSYLENSTWMKTYELGHKRILKDPLVIYKVTKFLKE